MADLPPSTPAPAPAAAAPSGVQAMLNWIGSNPLGKPAEDMVKRLSADSHVAVNALSTIARDGLVAVNALESYVETDEEVGPRVSVFELNEKQLDAIGREFTVMRDQAANLQAANLQLATLDSMDESRTRTLACVRVLAESQRSSAQVSQQLATHYDRFVSVVLNPLQGAAAVVQEKYTSYCNTVIEARRQKAQLQVLLRQKERAELRSLERTLIPSASKGAQGDNAFATDMEGNLAARSPTTLLWWSGYARLDTQRQVLLLLSKQTDPPSAASRAVALSKYTLAHELPEHFAKRAAAFELVPHDPELPVVVLASDGSMASRRWVAALQEAIDHLPEDEETPQESHASPGAQLAQLARDRQALAEDVTGALDGFHGSLVQEEPAFDLGSIEDSHATAAAAQEESDDEIVE